MSTMRRGRTMPHPAALAGAVIRYFAGGCTECAWPPTDQIAPNTASTPRTRLASIYQGNMGVLPSYRARNGRPYIGQFMALACYNLFQSQCVAPMPKIDLADEEFAAVMAAVRRTIAEDKFLFAPRLAPLESALAKLRSRLTAKSKPALPPPGQWWGAAGSLDRRCGDPDVVRNRTLGPALAPRASTPTVTWPYF